MADARDDSATEHGERHAGAQRSPGGPRGAVAALAAAVIAFGFQQTGVIPAIPIIQHDLHASHTWSAWLQTGYLVASVVLTPLTGKLADRFGKRRLLVAALALFLVGSVGAVFAPSMGWLIACRIVQGGGGAVFPLTLAIARDELPEGEVAGAIGLLTGGFGIGTALGFGGGAAIVQAIGWRWLFAVGAVAVAAAAALVHVAVPRSTSRSQAGLDLVGAALVSGGLSVVLVAMTEGASLGWGSAWVLGGFALGAALLAAWIAWDLHADDPMLDLEVLGQRTVLLANVATIGLGFAVFGLYFLIPYLLQAPAGGGFGFGADTLQSGLYLLPAAVGQLAGGPLAPRLAAAVGARWVYTLGLGLAAASAAGLALAHAQVWEVLLWTLVLGAGAGMAIGIASDLVAEAVSDHQSGIATSLNSVLRRLGGGIGGQVAAALLVALAVGGSPSASAFSTAFWVAAAVAAAAALVTLGIGGDRG